MADQVPLPPGTEVATVGGKQAWVCKLCAVTVFQSSGESTWRYHLDSPRHKRNTIIQQFNEIISQITDENRWGFGVNLYKSGRQDTPIPQEENGKFQIKLFENESQGILHLKIENSSVSPVILRAVNLLFSYNKDTRIESLPDPVELAPGATKILNLDYKFEFLGVYQIPLELEFIKPDGIQSEEGKIVKTFHVLRILYFRYTNHVAQNLAPTAPFQPSRFQFRKGLPPTGRHVIRGDRLNIENRIELVEVLPLVPNIMPLTLRLLAAKGFKEKEGMRNEEKEALINLLHSLKTPLTSENHFEKFTTLLNLEELQMEVNIRKYDLESAKIGGQVGGHAHLYEIKVPGLAEGRPSVVRGDWIYVKPIEMTDNIQYQGVVHKVNQDSLWVGFSNDFEHQLWSPHDRFKVEFSFTRLPIRMEHRAIQLANQMNYDVMLFPTNSHENSPPPMEVPEELDLYNEELKKNPQQLEAIRRILEGNHKPAPYILYGPPGTGKTVTIVEAMKQIIKFNPNAHILACAPSNNAADLLCSRLLTDVPKKQILRLNALSRSLKSVPEKIQTCSNIQKQHGRSSSFYIPEKDYIEKFKIVVCTTINAGRLVSGQFPPRHFSHVFIDEAGQASEPETLVPICGLSVNSNVAQSTSTKPRVVLAGDPKQLGPVLNSMMAEQAGLGMSLLERLMTTEKVYQRDETNQKFDSRFLTKLVFNYRSHPHIIKIPSTLFYDNELIACADTKVTLSLCNWEELPKKGVPVIFHGILGEDMREENSPSFFNPQEVTVVKYYLDKLLDGKITKSSQIGVIAPYQKQVQKMRQALTTNLRKYGDLSIGSVEEYQGAERKVIIVTTVRSNPDFLSMDKDFKLGFLTNPKRFNTAITRAKSLLIIIGNPYILERDKNWNAMLRFCVEKGAYKGVEYSPKLSENDVREDDISAKLENLHIIGDFDMVSQVRPVEQGVVVVAQE